MRLESTVVLSSGSGSHDQGSNRALSLAPLVILSKWSNFELPPPPLDNAHLSSTYFIGLLWGLNEWTHARPLEWVLAYIKCSVNASCLLEDDTRPSPVGFIHLEIRVLYLHLSYISYTHYVLAKYSTFLMHCPVFIYSIYPCLLTGFRFLCIKGLLQVLASFRLDPAKSHFLCSNPCPPTVRAV